MLGVPLLSVAPLGVVSGFENEPDAPTLITTDIEVTSGDIDELVGVDYDLAADIIVRNGGILYINSSMIMFNSASNGDYGIMVERGGELYIRDSNISAVEKNAHVIPSSASIWDEFWGYGWYFEFRGSGIVDNTDLSYMWGDEGNYVSDVAGGIQIYNDDVNITNSYIYNTCGSGITVGYDGLGYPYSDGSSPYIYNTVISNSTGVGLMVVGDSSAPYILDSQIIGCHARGAYFLIGTDALVNTTDFLDNKVDGAFVDDAGLTTATSTNTFNGCKFERNHHGIGLGNGAAAYLTDCEINNNEYSGVRDYLASGGPTTAQFDACDINDNGEYGINMTISQSSSIFYDCDVIGSGIHGANFNSNTGSILYNTRIANSGDYNVWSNGSASPVFESCEIFGGSDGGVRVTNGSTPYFNNTEIYGTPNGVLADHGDPTLVDANIHDCDTGVWTSTNSQPTISGGSFSDNINGLYIWSEGLTIDGITVADNTGVGAILRQSTDSTIIFSDFQNNAVGINIIGGGSTMFRNVTVIGSTTTGIRLEEEANLTAYSSTIAAGSGDAFHLEGASKANIYSGGDNFASSDVTMIDEASMFNRYWKTSLEVYDNVTLAPVTLADVIIYNNTGEVLDTQFTRIDGSVECNVAQYSFTGTTYIDHTPVNVTVFKSGYVPDWTPDHPNDMDYLGMVYLAENKAPSLPIPLGAAPTVTHMNRPTLTWGVPIDWNNDKIAYTINVWQDELGTGQMILENMVVKNPFYTFQKNLRYNREYWVEVVAFDPWGLSDTATFSFRTMNTPPTQPLVMFEETPVPSLLDIKIVIQNGSTDEDIEPIDDISYLVEWYAFREESWVIIKSGSNALVLDHNLTREGDKIRAIIKPFDGIEYGVPVILETDVVNFAPEALVKYVDIELMEDTPMSGLVDLMALFTDRDGDDLSFNVKVLRHVDAEIDKVTNEITFIPDLDWSGVDYLIIESLDGKAHLTDNPTIRINVTVEAVNDDPVIVSVNDKLVEKGSVSLVQSIQGTSAVISVMGYDPDGIYGDEYTYSTNFEEVIGPGVLQENDLVFEITTGRMSIFLRNDLVGEHIFNLTITDLEGASTSIPIRLLVENRNDEPTKPNITSHENDEVIRLTREDKYITFSASGADDPDLHIPDSEEKLEYDWNFGQGWILNQELQITREFTAPGEYVVQFRVRDSFGLYQISEVTVNVNITIDPGIPDDEKDETFMEEFGLWVIFGIILLIIIIVIILLVVKRDDLSDKAEEVEKEHEALVAKQQEDALDAQEKLQALMSGVPYPETTGPALPAAGGEGEGYDALPAASPDAAPMDQPPLDQYPPQEGYAEQPPAYEQPSMEQPPMEPAPMEPQMQAAPMEPPAPEPVPEPVQEPVPGAVPPTEPAAPQDPSYLPPQE